MKLNNMSKRIQSTGVCQYWAVYAVRGTSTEICQGRTAASVAIFAAAAATAESCGLSSEGGGSR